MSRVTFRCTECGELRALRDATASSKERLLSTKSPLLYCLDCLRSPTITDEGILCPACGTVTVDYVKHLQADCREVMLSTNGESLLKTGLSPTRGGKKFFLKRRHH